MSKAIEAVIFDMDGLMFDTERLHIALWRRVEEESGVHFRAGMPDMTGMSAAAIEALYRKRYGDAFDYRALRARVQAYAEDYVARHGVPVKPGLAELLEALRSMGLKRALATSTYRVPALKLIRRAGLEDCFDAMVFGDAVERSKPDPQIFLTAARTLGCPPVRTLVLEDSVNGANAACAGGFPTIMIPDLQQPDGALEARLTGKFGSLLDVISFIKTEV